jgi:hypothetical protein
MPLEIRELVIRVNIEEQAVAPVNNVSARELQALKEKIIRECMEKLLSNMENISVR